MVTKSGETLKIGLEISVVFRSVTLRVEIGLPELSSLELSGGSRGTIKEIVSSNAFSVELSGGSKLGGNFVTSKNVSFNLTGGSQLDDFSGEAKKK